MSGLSLFLLACASIIAAADAFALSVTAIWRELRR